MSVTGVFLDRDSLDFVERNLVLSAVIKLGCPRRFVVSDLLRHFQLAAILQIRSNAGRAEGMIANPGFDAGGFGARKFSGASRSCGQLFSIVTESRIPAAEGLLEISVENFCSRL